MSHAVSADASACGTEFVVLQRVELLGCWSVSAVCVSCVRLDTECLLHALLHTRWRSVILR